MSDLSDIPDAISADPDALKLVLELQALIRRTPRKDRAALLDKIEELFATVPFRGGHA